MGEKNREIKRKKAVALTNCICNLTRKKYIRTDLLGLCRGRFSLVQACLFSFSCDLNPLQCLSDSLKPCFSNSLSTNSLFWVFGAEVHPPFGLGTQNESIQLAD